ncbi:hypothetical protein BCV70DRAFT_202725 [Testicularia cyperi]|uniref:Pre-mRNA-splicing factor SLT11 n=1 Tax=Testicularia cyperi TaxID=1882483 RepID=A0A317XJ46_9BASI|nr:hypothetical protein BCV70DRAFT_202725 [Testicularia cyperi]
MSAWSSHGKIGTNISGAEEADTPILCEKCLGPNPYIRMTKDSQGKACKICTRPFTVFRWNPGAGSRFKKTEICTTCAKVKNVCQTCILDLQYGLPVQVRDAALNIKSSGPTSDVNREYFAERMDRQLEGPTSLAGSAAGPSTRIGQEMLKKLTRKEPDYKRSRPQLCSAFARGNCPRGDACPYKHELPAAAPSPSAPTPSTSASAPRIASARPDSPKGLAPPEDKSVISLFLSSLPEQATEDEIRSWTVDLHPRLQTRHVKSITLVPTSKCAFVNFVDREAAEIAASQCAIRMNFNGKDIRMTWGRSKPSKKPAPTSSS